MKKITLSVLMALMPMICHSMDTGGFYKINRIWSWGGYTNGAVLIQIENSNSLCPNGYWFQDSENSGSKNLMSMALAAYYAKSPVMIYANENSDWSGLSSKECEIKAIVVESL